MGGAYQPKSGDLSVNELIRAAVLPIVPICEPDQYRGAEREYTTFNYTELAGLVGDDDIEAVVYLVQLHWFIPRGINPLSKKRRLRAALIDAGFTAPEIINDTDEDGQHYVFECQYAGGA